MSVKKVAFRKTMGFLVGAVAAICIVGADAFAAPVGFGSGTTGGQGGAVVTVSTPQQLSQALCGTYVGTTCTDNTPRIIQLNSVIDFTGTEGTTTSLGCTYSENSCTSSTGKQERILSWNSYCSGKPTYNITFDTAGNKALSIGSNKTIIGIGTTAGIKGKGLYIGNATSNIIIRNLSITDINEGIVWAGDAITIDNGTNIWIDHNYFSRIGRQMIVTGWGTAKGVTISNNFFDGQSQYGHYCNDRHYWVMLLNADQQEITVFANRFHKTSGRSPEAGMPQGGTGGVIHLVSNLYTDNYYMGVSPSPDAYMLMEGNYFTPMGNYFFPIFTTNTADRVYAPLDETLASTDTTCRAVLGRACVPNYSQNEHPSFRLNTAVTSALNANAVWKGKTGSLIPIPYANVTNYVTAHAGPQVNPDL
jgi:pectin lyase